MAFCTLWLQHIHHTNLHRFIANRPTNLSAFDACHKSRLKLRFPMLFLPLHCAPPLKYGHGHRNRLLLAMTDAHANRLNACACRCGLCVTTQLRMR